ncbi:MAG: hypothetical protein B7Z03_00335 [Hydrogenophilales bacterium 32-62-9]|nr:MAG: hypothetical protein B7Z03_00335 [Hydrogenophilales bacterium 32-62-9]
MHTMQFLTSRYRINGLTPAGAEPVQCRETPEDRMAAVMDALEEIGELIKHQCYSRPGALTEDSITAYALALMQLRECACAAGLGRLTKACDALAVTVARLIEDKNCTCIRQCEALTRFVVHARAMLQMNAETIRPHSVPRALAGTLAAAEITGAGTYLSLQTAH